MYLGSRPKRRRSSPLRVLILLILIGIGVYILIQIRQEEEVETPFVPTPTPTRTAASCLVEAENLYWDGDLKETIAAYELAVELGAGSLEPYIHLPRLLALEGETVRALAWAREAVERAPEDARAWAVLGMAYDWHGQVDKAIEACQRALELTPDYPEAYAYLAEAYADDGQWQEATESAETALQLDDESVDVQRNYGYVMEVQGNYTQAVEAYKKALSIHPNLAYLHIAVGKNYLALGSFDAAMESFQTALEVDPSSAEAYYRLGRAHYDQGEHEKAQEFLQMATEADPRFGAAFGYLAFAYWSRRNYEDAIPNLERAILLDSWAARRRAQGFVISMEDRQGQLTSRSTEVVMEGSFEPVSLLSADVLQASLRPELEDGAWDDARGSVTLDARPGVFTVTLTALPDTRPGQAYVGWLEGVRTLSGDPVNTGPLDLDNGSLDDQFEVGWVQGPRIDYFYTLGLAYYFLDECEKARPYFDAALQINPADENALRGVQLCSEAGS